MSFKRVAAVALCAVALAAGAVGAPSTSANTPVNAAFALAASGLLQIERVPNVNNVRGFAQDSVVDFSTPNHTVRARVLNAEAGKEHAKASVADLTVDLSPVKGLDLGAARLTATAVEARCGRGSVGSSLAGARLGSQALNVAAPANTTVKVPGLVSVVLNKQTLHRNGSITVAAVSITLTGTQTLNIASATCHATSTGEDPPPPTSTPPTPGNDTPDDNTAISGQAPRPTPIPGHLDVTG